MYLKYLNAKVTQQKSGNALLLGKCIFIKVQNSSSFEAQNEEHHNWKSDKERAFTILTSLLRIFGITVYVKNKIKRPSNIYGILKIDWKGEKITFSTG